MASLDSTPLDFRPASEAEDQDEPYVHIYANGAVCDTDTRGQPTPGGRSVTELVVDSSEGFIPLWGGGVTLRWRFDERSMMLFLNPEGAKAALRALMGEALMAWGHAVPVRIQEVRDGWDFEVRVANAKKCNRFGCTLARAFFPDSGQHDLMLYPSLFEQPRPEQVETLAHEFGHIFGLRHFFADIREQQWSSEIFGEHKPFSIMNYGAESILTQADRDDLTRLYGLARSRQLTQINGTDIRLIRPFSEQRLHPFAHAPGS